MHFLHYHKPCWMDIPELNHALVAAVKKYAQSERIQRNQLPFRLQFLPFVSQHIAHRSDICFLNPVVPFGWLTEYSKSLLHWKIDQQWFPPSEYRSQWDSTKPSLKFPIYCKTDTWERGVWVFFCPDQQSLDKAIKHIDQDFSLQEASHYHNEYCVQFYKINDTFRIWSITQRVTPTVTGDGIHTLRDLISPATYSNEDSSSYRCYYLDAWSGRTWSPCTYSCTMIDWNYRPQSEYR